MTDDLFSRLQASRVVAQGRVRIGGYTAMSRKAPRLIDYRRENQNTEAVFCASPSRLPRVVPIALGSALEAWHFRAHHAAPYFPSVPRFGPVPVPAGPFSPATEPRYRWSRLDSLLPRSPQNSYQRSAVRTKGLPHRSGIQSPLSPLTPIQAYPSNISTPMSGDEEPTLIHQASANAASSNQEPDVVSAQSTESTPSAGTADNEMCAMARLWRLRRH